MKKVLLIFITIYFLRPILPLVNYIVQYDYIVKELCENRNNPTSDCKGSCYLKAELAKTAETDHTKDFRFPVVESIQFMEPLFEFNVLPIIPETKSENWYYNNRYAYLYTSLIERPPSV